MSQLNYYRIGRTTVWRGAPLRIVIRTDPFTEEAQMKQEGEHPSVSISIYPPEMEDLEPDPYHVDFDIEHGLHRLEIPTNNFQIGHHEARIRIGMEEEFQIPETIWVLDRDAYRSMVLQENEEPFLPSPPLKGGDSVLEFVDTLILQSLDTSVLQRDGSVFYGCSRSTPEGVPERSFASGPIRWTTQSLVNELRDLSLFGFEDFQCNLLITNIRFRLLVQCFLHSPLSEAIAKSVLDPDCGRLSLLNSSEDLPGFQIELNGVEGGSSYLHLSVEHQIGEFPISD